MIKNSELLKITNDCFDHTIELLKLIKFLFENNKIPPSIFFSIILLEETGKLATYSSYLRRSEDVPDSIETKLRKEHLFKLRQLVDLEVQRNEILKKQIGSMVPLLYDSDINPERLKQKIIKFDKVKQLALYYDYKKEKSIDLYHHFEKHKITKNNLAHFCFILVNLAYSYLMIEKIRQKYGDKDGIIDSTKIQQNDSDYINLRKVLDDIKSKKDTSLAKFQGTFSELMLLHAKIYGE